jgi:hypothetical protein
MFEMSAASPAGKADTLRGRPGAWSGVVWLLVMAAVCGVADALALPDAGVWLGMPLAGHEMFRPEWLVVGTLAALPLFRLARASLVLGSIGFLLCSAEMFTIVDNGRERYAHNVEVYGHGPSFSEFYYVFAAVQLVVFLVFTVKGLRLRWADRRFQAMMRKLSTRTTVPITDVTPREQVPD